MTLQNMYSSDEKSNEIIFQNNLPTTVEHNITF